MIVTKAIYNILSTYSGLTALVNTRIYPVVAAQQSPEGYVVFDVPRTDPYNRTSGRARMDQIQVDVSAFSKDFTVAANIGEQIRNALDRVTPGTYGGVIVQVVLFDGEYPIFHDNTGIGDGIHEIRGSYRVSINTGAAA